MNAKSFAIVTIALGLTACGGGGDSVDTDSERDTSRSASSSLAVGEATVRASEAEDVDRRLAEADPRNANFYKMIKEMGGTAALHNLVDRGSLGQLEQAHAKYGIGVVQGMPGVSPSTGEGRASALAVTDCVKQFSKADSDTVYVGLTQKPLKSRGCGVPGANSSTIASA